MIDYGRGPAGDELEITLFGPGVGEAIAVHLGDGNWLLVDSCMDPETNGPATYAYLEAIGVLPQQVRVIVASHWHDDHVRGISTLAARYPNAEFMLSAVLNGVEGSAFLAAYSGSAAPGLVRGTQELFSVIRDRSVVFFLQQRMSVIELRANDRDVRVSALSPVPQAFAKSLAHFAQYLPKSVKQIGHAPDLQPNLEAIVLHIDFGGEAALLGSDLENHSSLGWGVVVSDRWCLSRPPATVYKVAHHGSSTADDPRIWSNLLATEPVACVAPFGCGRRLPADSDRVRIKQHARRAYLTSGTTRRPDMDAGLLNRLQGVCKKISRVNSSLGAIRLRKPPMAVSWGVELLGAACSL